MVVRPGSLFAAATCAAAVFLGEPAAAANGAQGIPDAAISAALSQPRVVPKQPARALSMAITRVGERMVAVGEHGGVALSDDAGKTWRAARSVPTDATLTNLRFADTKTGWAVGHLGVVLRTDDAGETWTRQLDGIEVAKLASAQAALGADVERPAAQAQAKRLMEDGPDKPWLDLAVESTSRVTVVGAFGTALRTEDGGKNWSVIGWKIPNPSGFHLYAVAQKAGETLIAGEQGLLLRAQANGAYSALKSPYEGSFFGALVVAPGHYFVYGLRGHAFVTTDGGSSWTRSAIDGATATFNAATTLRDGRLVLCDQAGRVFISSDGGRRFKAVPSGGAPVTGAAESPTGDLLLSSFAGVVAVSLTAPAQGPSR